MVPGWDIPRWYGFLFALGFILSQQVMFYIFKKDGRNEKEVETVTMYMVIGVVVGARLGHCLFYDPVLYLLNPHKILFYLGRRFGQSWGGYWYTYRALVLRPKDEENDLHLDT